MICYDIMPILLFFMIQNVCASLSDQKVKSVVVQVNVFVKMAFLESNVKNVQQVILEQNVIPVFPATMVTPIVH